MSGRFLALIPFKQSLPPPAYKCFTWYYFNVLSCFVIWKLWICFMFINSLPPNNNTQFLFSCQLWSLREVTWFGLVLAWEHFIRQSHPKSSQFIALYFSICLAQILYFDFLSFCFLRELSAVLAICTVVCFSQDSSAQCSHWQFLFLYFSVLPPFSLWTHEIFQLFR